MKPITAKTFSVNFPPLYEYVYTLQESIMAEHKQDDKCLSYINISLQELSTFDDCEGDDLLTRFRAFCLDERGTVEVIADKTIHVAGHNSVIRTAQAAKGEFYYFGLLPVNTEHGYLFIGDCDSGSKEYYEPLFDEIWQSLQYFGNPAKALKEKDNTEPLINKIEPFSIPPNNKEFWQIADHHFKLSHERPCNISESDGAFVLAL